MKLSTTDWADKSWIKAQKPVENYETHWNSPYQNSKPRRFIFAALIMLCVFLIIFGNQLAKSKGVEKYQRYDITNHASIIKNDNEFWWTGNICMAPAYYDKGFQQHYSAPIPEYKPGTVPEPGTPLTIGLGLIALAIKLKPRVKGMRMANDFKTHKSQPVLSNTVKHR